MISLERFSDFNPKFEVVSCFIECQDKILLLHRQNGKPQGGTWGVPAGKVDAGENLSSAIIREVKEETKIVIPDFNINYFTKLYVKYPDYDFEYNIFSSRFSVLPRVRINRLEHSEFLWITPGEALKLPLIQDEDFCIKLFYRI